MDNWMQKFENRKDKLRERELNTKLEEMLDLLDEAYRDKDRVKVLEKIIKVYDELRIDACDYDEKDYISKKKELLEIRDKIKKQECMESSESQSWDDYKKEELVEDGEER